MVEIPKDEIFKNIVETIREPLFGSGFRSEG